MPKNASSAKWSLESYCIGMKLRSLRAGKRLTLAQLAEETGLSTALLSKLETERLIPTLATLANIACVYGVGMSYFFRDSARHFFHHAEGSSGEPRTGICKCAAAERQSRRVSAQRKDSGISSRPCCFSNECRR